MNEIFLILSLVMLLLVYIVVVIFEHHKTTGKIFPENNLSSLSISLNSNKNTITWSFIATSLGGAVTIGLIGLTYKGGAVFFAVGVGLIIGLSILKGLIPRIRSAAKKSKAYTFNDYLGGDNKYTVKVVSIINFIAFFGLAVAQIIALNLLIKEFLPSYGDIPLLIILLFLSFYLLYGIKGVFYSEKIQVAVIVLWFATILYAIINNFHSFSEISNLKTEYLIGLGMGKVFLIGALALFPWTVVARADLWQRIVSAKTDIDAKKSVNTTIGVMAIVYLFIVIAGIYIKINYPNIANSNTSAFYFIKEVPVYLQYIGILGIFSALVSSLDSFINISSISIANLFKNKQKNYGYIVGLVVSVCLLYLLSDYDLGVVIIFASTIFALLVPSFIYETIYSRGFRKLYLHSILSGIFVSILLFLLEVDQNIIFVPALAISTMALLLFPKE